ncbi:MAG TPA: pyruvate kinase [Chloroflexota bacterium]
MRRAKIVCTLGPSTNTPEVLRALLRAGMDVARINFSHGTHESNGRLIELARQAAAEEGVPLAILQDLQGPRLRLGEIEGGQVEVADGDELVLTTEPMLGSARRISVTGIDLPGHVAPGDRILLDGGAVEVVVSNVRPGEVETRVISGGTLRSRVGINLPGVTLKIPALTEKDRADLAFGLRMDVDYVAMSFVRTGAEVRELRVLMERLGRVVPIIAKIEKREAVANFEEILEEADGIMVARGDLGVEMPMEEVPLLQKHFIHRSRAVGKPVITATQMLDSMIREPRPTRAEVADVANAILDGTDATMLSGETAIGQYPVQSVRTMARIAEVAERALPYASYLEEMVRTRASTITEAIGEATASIARELSVAAVIPITQSGYTARMVAKYRPVAPIYAVTPNVETQRRLSLVWGVRALIIQPHPTTEEMVEEALRTLQDAGRVKPDDLVVITAGVPVGVPGRTNLLHVRRVVE